MAGYTDCPFVDSHFGGFCHRIDIYPVLNVENAAIKRGGNLTPYSTYLYINRLNVINMSCRMGREARCAYRIRALAGRPAAVGKVRRHFLRYLWRVLRGSQVRICHSQLQRYWDKSQRTHHYSCIRERMGGSYP